MINTLLSVIDEHFQKNEQMSRLKKRNEMGFCAFSISKKRSFSTAESAPSCLINRAALGGTHNDDARHLWLKHHLVSSSCVLPTLHITVVHLLSFG